MPVLLVLWVIWDRNWFLRKPSEKVEYLMHIPLFSFFPQGRSHRWALSPNGELCRFLFAVLQVLWCCHKLLSSFLFLKSPGIQSMLFLISALSQVWQKPLPWAEHWCIVYSSLSLPREKAQVGLFLLIVGSVMLRGRTDMVEMKCLILPVSMQLFLASSLPGVLWLSNWILEFL